MMTQLMTADSAAPVQRIKKDEITAAVSRMRAIVPNGNKMTVESLTIIAQEAILFRILPGRDMHYYEGRNGLVRIPDYKYLKNFSSFKEQLLSGDDTATVEDNYRVLTDEEKVRHGIAEHCIAAECRLVTKRERRAFGDEVRQWIDTGFPPKEAVELARQIYGEIGTAAIGVFDPKELDRFGKPVTSPKGWSPLQVAEKLAFKNAINRKYGIPTADEMSAMAHRMAHKAMPEHWKDKYADQPIDVQARLANLEAQAAEIAAESEGMTTEDHETRLAGNVDLTRGPVDEGGIGEDWEGEIIEGEVSNGTEPPPSFETIDDLLHALHADFGLSETDAKATLKSLGYTGFPTNGDKRRVSSEMYTAVKAAMTERPAVAAG